MIVNKILTNETTKKNIKHVLDLPNLQQGGWVDLEVCQHLHVPQVLADCSEIFIFLSKQLNNCMKLQGAC